jgi:ABC-type antimicrobial peptide transport system permease subunit
MFRHYLTVAFRNLRKYKNQTLISVIGLAVGFTCFAMAMLWIRYEMTYDSFHKNADRMYCVYTPDVFSSNGISRHTPFPLAGYLKETFPEVANVTAINLPYESRIDVEVEGVPYPSDYLEVDSTFLGTFDVKIVEGSRGFLIRKTNNVAITQEKARQLFGNESPIGKTVDLDGEKTICAVITGYSSKRSNYPFDFLCPNSIELSYSINGVPQPATDIMTSWTHSGAHTVLELAPGINLEAFKKKLYEHKIRGGIEKMTLMPLADVHYKDPTIEREVKFQHILLFALAGSLVILCTLFNYLTLFTCRFRIRQREIALRTVCGASGKSLFMLLSVEFIMSLTVALLLGLCFIQIALAPFKTLSGVNLELSAIYSESILYIVAIILLSLLLFLLVLWIFRRRSLNAVMRRGNTNLFRKMSIVAQLIISIGFAFCTIVIVKQMYYLHNTDLGFEFKNRASVEIYSEIIDAGVFENEIKQIPEITETIKNMRALMPPSLRGWSYISEWEGKLEGDEQILIGVMMKFSVEYVDFYKLRIVEGQMITEGGGEDDVLINESAAKAFGWDKPVGKTFNIYKTANAVNSKIVRGVVKNTYNFAPTIAAKPIFYSCQPEIFNTNEQGVIFKYREGTWDTCKDKIERIIKEKFPEDQLINIYNAEEEYDKYLKSENVLLKLLSFVSMVCLIICIFGFVSMVSLTCEERRKEIAIRKINGATMHDILSIFFKEYFLLLVAGAVVAFPIGYYIMRQWLEQYMVQTPIPAWIYLSILFALVLVIVLCVGWRVYKASVENPADVIKQ